MKVNKETTVTYSFEDISKDDMDVITFALEQFEETVDVNSKLFSDLCEVQNAFNVMWSDAK